MKDSVVTITEKVLDQTKRMKSEMYRNMVMAKGNPRNFNEKDFLKKWKTAEKRKMK